MNYDSCKVVGNGCSCPNHPSLSNTQLYVLCVAIREKTGVPREKTFEAQERSPVHMTWLSFSSGEKHNGLHTLTTCSKSMNKLSTSCRVPWNNLNVNNL